MTPDPATVRELELLSANRQTEQQLARMELAVAAHFGFHPPDAPPYHVLMGWLLDRGGAEGFGVYYDGRVAEAEDEP